MEERQPLPADPARPEAAGLRHRHRRHGRRLLEPAGAGGDGARLPEVRHLARARHRPQPRSSAACWRRWSTCPGKIGAQVIAEGIEAEAGARDRCATWACPSARGASWPPPSWSPMEAPRWRRERAHPLLPRAHARAGGASWPSAAAWAWWCSTPRAWRRSRTSTARDAYEEVRRRIVQDPGRAAGQGLPQRGHARPWTSRAACASCSSSTASGGAACPPPWPTSRRCAVAPAGLARRPTSAAPPSRTSRRRRASRSATGWRCYNPLIHPERIVRRGAAATRWRWRAHPRAGRRARWCASGCRTSSCASASSPPTSPSWT